jgi:hypothetical protein
MLCDQRCGMAADACDPAGICHGSNTGKIFSSDDEGESWRVSRSVFDVGVHICRSEAIQTSDEMADLDILSRNDKLER